MRTEIKRFLSTKTHESLHRNTMKTHNKQPGWVNKVRVSQCRQQHRLLQNLWRNPGDPASASGWGKRRNADVSDGRSLFASHLLQCCSDNGLNLSSKVFLPDNIHTY